MLTREQIEEIQAESREKGVPIKRLLLEKGVPEHQYFWWKRKYSREAVPEGFLPVSGVMPPAVTAAKKVTKSDQFQGKVTKSDRFNVPWFGNEPY
jgi:hypothetical protein